MRKMRRQRNATGAKFSIPQACAGALVFLAPVLLAACSEEDAARRQSARNQSSYPAIGERVNRARKGDRLVTRAWRERRSLADARARAHETPEMNQPGGAPLSGFYRALIALKSGVRQDPVTILHLGDSHIAADGFSGDLRDKFQRRFGDAGRGMMMPGFPFPYFRARGVAFERTGKWRAANSFTGDAGPYGISGVRLSAAKSGAKLGFTSTQGPFEWAEAAFLTRAKGGVARVSFGGASREISTRSGTPEIKRVRFARKGQNLEIETKGSARVTLLSVSAGNNRPGIRYVNFGIPGATADTPRRWDAALVADDLAHLKPDLIVLGYGTNEGFNDDLDPGAYGARVTAFLKRLKGDAPQAGFLILGPPDSARLPKFARKNKASAPCRALSETERRDYARLRRAKSAKLARWHPPPKLAAVRGALRRVADEQGARFWDWSQVMKGPCGIHAWTGANPPLAASDHVHLRSAGAKRSAAALFEELMRGYEAHVKLAVR